MRLDETALLRRQGMDSSSRSRIVCEIFISQDLDSQTKNLVHTHKKVDALFLEMWFWNLGSDKQNHDSMFSRFWQEFFKNKDFANFSELCL